MGFRAKIGSHRQDKRFSTLGGICTTALLDSPTHKIVNPVLTISDYPGYAHVIIAYSYIRLSTDHQLKGDGLARQLNRVYFEKRSFSSSGSRLSLTQRRSAMARGSRFRRTSKAATRRIRSSALAWQW